MVTTMKNLIIAIALVFIFAISAVKVFTNIQEFEQKAEAIKTGAVK
jgi:hypothetical protein